MIGTYFSLSSIFFLIIFLILFFTKEKIKTIETLLYGYLIVLTLFGTFVDVISGYLYFNNYDINSLLYCSLTKIMYIYFMTWAVIFFDYVYSISIKKNININRKLLYMLLVFISIAMFILPVSFELKNGLITPYGIGLNITYIFIFIFLLLSLILTIKNIREFKLKKSLPIFLVIGLLILSAIIQKIFPYLYLINYDLCLIVIIMFFTIENPDVKMLEEIEKNREITEKSIEDKANMLFKITEDVKTPISKIEILSNKIIRNDEIDEIHVDAKNINSLSRDVNNTINNVIGITNYDISNLKVSDISYDMYNLFKEIVIMTKEKLNENISFYYHMSSTIPDKLYGDSLKIKQIIYSIIMNAIDNTNNGSIDLNIESINRDNVCRLIIVVSDTGIGMDAYEINEILESSTSIDEEEINKINDLDVDLKIVKKMIDMLGGSLLIKSKEKEGSTFTIILNQGVESSKKKKNTNILSNKKKCLIICDDYHELERLSLEFTKNNYLVSTSLYGMDLLKEINNNYDLILIDDEMKPHNAVEVIKKLDKNKENIIIMLNKDKESIKDHYLKDYSFIDYLLKDNYKEEIKRLKEKYK